MEKEIRKMLCGKCLKVVRDIEARKQKQRRHLKVKMVGQVSGKIKISKIK
jgi:hypothetical protein